MALVEVKVPDIGDYKDVPVIEVLVKAGDRVEKEQSIVVLESDKATMDVPSSHSGVVKEVKVKVGDSISEGAIVLVLEESGASAPAATQAAAPVVAKAEPVAAPIPKVEPPIVRAPAPPPVSNTPVEIDPTASHASPSVRKFARELGVAVHQVKGSGPKGRITQEDVQAFVKAAIASCKSFVCIGSAFSLAVVVPLDFGGVFGLFLNRYSSWSFRSAVSERMRRA